MTPDFIVEIDGKKIRREDAGIISSITIKDEVGTKADEVTIEVSNRDRALKKPKRGTRLEPSIGYVGETLKLMGRYTVDGVSIREGRMIIKAYGFDALGKIKSTGDGVYNDVTLGDIVRKVASKNGLTAKVSPEFEKSRRQIIQQNESDLSFLNRLAKENNATLKAQGSEILFVPKNSGTTAGGRALPSLSIRVEDIDSDWSYDEGKREEFGEISAKYSDLKTGDLDGVAKVGSGEPKKTLQKTYGSKVEAEAAIKAHKEKSRSSAETLSFSIVGRPEYVSERRISIKGLDPDVDGSWVIQTAQHVIGKGYKVSVTCKKALFEEGDE